VTTVEEIVKRLEVLEDRLVIAEKALASTERERDEYRPISVQSAKRASGSLASS